MKVAQLLDKNGFFLIRDSVIYLAQAINVTRYTIDNYLNELRNSNKTMDDNEKDREDE